MDFQIQTYPTFSWSLSRHKTLMNCPRQYAFHYYVSHNGWLQSATPLAKHAYRLKKLTTLPLLFGSATHEFIERSLKDYMDGRPIPDAEIFNRTIRMNLNRAFQMSTKMPQLWQERPSKYPMLHEIYYDGVVSQEAIAEMNERIDGCTTHFYKSKSYETLTNPSTHIVQVERFDRMILEETPIYVSLDVLYKDHEGTWYIIDWKTGYEYEDDPLQLALYALFVMDKYTLASLDNLVIRNEYLFLGKTKEYTLSNDLLHRIDYTMKASIEEMKKYLVDVEQNQPVDVTDFPAYPEPKKCQRCPFQELCQHRAN